MLAATAASAVVFVLSKCVFTDASWYVQYCIDRGYKPVGVIKGELSVALRMLCEGEAQVIVFAHRERQILDDEMTRRLPDSVAAVVRPASEVRLRPEAADVRQAIEGTGPVPTGMDSVSIAAARRIARHFRDHGCGS